MNKLSYRVENRIKHAIIEEFHIPNYLLNSETIFKEDLGFDEYDMVFLALALEDEFEFLLTEDLKVKEMNELVRLVITQLKQAQSHSLSTNVLGTVVNLN